MHCGKTPDHSDDATHNSTYEDEDKDVVVSRQRRCHGNDKQCTPAKKFVGRSDAGNEETDRVQPTAGGRFHFDQSQQFNVGKRLAPTTLNEWYVCSDRPEERKDTSQLGFTGSRMTSFSPSFRHHNTHTPSFNPHQQIYHQQPQAIAI